MRGILVRALFPIAATLAGAAMLTPLGAVAAQGDAVRSMLEGMGYEGIRLNGCLLPFARRVDSSEKADGFSSYVRRLNLETVEDFSVDISSIESTDSSTINEMTFNPTSDYQFRYLGFGNFWLWINKYSLSAIGRIHDLSARTTARP
jgi:hypothetical protein